MKYGGPMRLYELADSRPGRKSSLGFSLIELMVAVAIVAILLSVGIPSYRDYVRRGVAAEAVAAIGQGRVAAEQFFLDNRTYEDMPCPDSTRTFDIVCDDPAEPDATTYTITATGNGNMAGFVYTVNQANVRTTASPWGDGNCWITRRGDGC
jgi:type IV pilus assembly protein PilE